MRVRPLFRRTIPALAAFAALALVAGCASTGEGKGSAAESSAAPSEITITDNHGEIKVPVNPKRVVALDNTAMQVLADWDVKLVAAPKRIFGDLWPQYTDDKAVLDIGNHREPDLEKIVEADPDLVIGGYRFASHYDKIKSLVQVPVVELNPRDGENHTSELKREVTLLGEIFDHKDDAKKISDGLDTAVKNAKEAYDGKSTVMGLIASGGKLAYAAPHDGRGVGVLFDELGLKPAIDRKASDEASHGDEISVEAIAAANPEWLIVLDRDGAFHEEGYVPAKDMIEKSEALKNVPAVKNGHIVYLDSNFYLDEGIGAYTKLYQQVADSFAKGK